MNKDYINKLVESFYKGETTKEEEQLLLNYFQGKDVEEELLEEKELFISLYKSDPIDVPAGLETKLENLIDELAVKEKTSIKPQQNKKIILKWAGSIAAGIAILVTAGLIFSKQNDGVAPPLTNMTDEQKIKEAQEALILLSTKFNEGMDQLASASTNLNKTNEILNKTFNRKKNKES